MKVAYFDFCETLVNFQTADSYVDYVRKHLCGKQMNILHGMQRIFYNLKLIPLAEKVFPKRSINKRITLYQLKGIEKNVLEKLAFQYYQECIKPNFIRIVLEKLLELKKEGYVIWIVSGGYDIYLKYFVKEYDLEGLLSTRIKFSGEVCTGCFDGWDCMREKKIVLLKKYLPWATDSPNSYAFSDSLSDLPLLRYARQGVVISKHHSQVWASHYKLQEIIWQYESKERI